LIWAAFSAESRLASAASKHAKSEDPKSKSEKLSSPCAAALERLNHYRKLVGLESVAEDPQLTLGSFQHARYMIKNQVRKLGPEMHTETIDNGWYSPEGHYAAATGNVIPAAPFLIGAYYAVDSWVAEPFQRLLMLDPALNDAGYGSYCDNGRCAAALVTIASDSRVGNVSEYMAQEDSPGIRIQAPYHRAIEFPPHNSTITIYSYRGGEWPDPLASCPGYRLPTGFPITLQLGPIVSSNVSAHDLLEDGRSVEHCLIDDTNYTGRDNIEESLVRDRLDSYGAIVIVPRAPLNAGRRYVVSIVAGGRPYKWSFAAASIPAVTEAAASGNGAMTSSAAR
jgi:uncharacterized protein YkwD